jgi:hypothetical protein
VALKPSGSPSQATVTFAGRSLKSAFKPGKESVEVAFATTITVRSGSAMTITLNEG